MLKSAEQNKKNCPTRISGDKHYLEGLKMRKFCRVKNPLLPAWPRKSKVSKLPAPNLTTLQSSDLLVSPFVPPLDRIVLGCSVTAEIVAVVWREYS